eukprot:1368064-Amorphochlora_amoeboformis.AAC.1
MSVFDLFCAHLPPNRKSITRDVEAGKPRCDGASSAPWGSRKGCMPTCHVHDDMLHATWMDSGETVVECKEGEKEEIEFESDK